MLKPGITDNNLIINILSDAFATNGSVNYIVRQDAKKQRRIRALMAYSLRMCELFGEVWLSDDKNACALVLYPQRKRTTLTTIWLDIQLVIKAIGIGGIAKTMRREAQIGRIKPKAPMAYLWFIGVAPPHQHSGAGSRLLQEVLRHTRPLPMYLETSMPQNLPWYQRFGFDIYGRLEMGYTLYFLRREAD